MMTIVRSRRISKGGYSPGDQTLVSGPVFIRDEDLLPTFIGPTAEEVEFDVQSRIESARQEGYLDGFRKGVVEGQRSIEGEAGLLRGYLEQLDEGIGAVWAKVEVHVATLAMEIARKVVGEVVSAHDSLAIDLARRGIALAHEQTKVSLLVNPGDAEALRAASADLLRTAEGVRYIEVIERGSIAKGGIIVECEVGLFDLRPEVQLELIEKKLEIAAIETTND